jgi:hypothetical protein
LCEECDKVFHKAASKKSHIRVPILNIDPVVLGKTLSGNNLESDMQINFYALYLLSESFKCRALQSCEIQHNKFDNSESLNEWLRVRESISIILIGSIRCILKDRRVRFFFRNIFCNTYLFSQDKISRIAL